MLKLINTACRLTQPDWSVRKMTRVTPLVPYVSTYVETVQSAALAPEVWTSLTRRRASVSSFVEAGKTYLLLMEEETFFIFILTLAHSAVLNDLPPCDFSLLDEGVFSFRYWIFWRPSLSPLQKIGHHTFRNIKILHLISQSAADLCSDLC